MDERREEEVPEVKAIPVAQMDGEFIRVMEGKLPAITLEMAEGYPRNTHLKLEVEVRVRGFHYDEISRGPQKGDLVRQHLFALEEVKLIGAYAPEELDPGVGGSASAAAIGAEPEEEPEESQLDESVGF